MLNTEIVNRANDRIELECLKLIKRLTDNINLCSSNLAPLGLAPNDSIGKKKISELCAKEIMDCAQMSWETLRRFVTSFEVKYSEELALELKNIVGSHLQENVCNIKERCLQPYNLDSILEGDLSGASNHELRIIETEIVLFIQSLKEKSEMREDKGDRSKVGKINNAIVTTSLSVKTIWDVIEKDFDINKRAFGKKINFVTDEFKRQIIFRDIGHAYILANNGFYKPAVILAGSVIEELLRLYLKSKEINPSENTFNSYIITCEDNDLIKKAVQRLTDSFRHFRNIVHLKNEKIPSDSISKATAKGAVSSIFTIINDF